MTKGGRRGLLGFVFASLSLGLLGCAGDSATIEPGNPFPKSVTDEAEAKLRAWVDTGKASGVMMQVTTTEGTWSSAYGVSDQATNTPMSTPLQFRIGSITKTFTTTLILQLVKEGKLGLDDKISKYVENVPGGDKITLRMLGDMTAGLNEYLGNPRTWEIYWANPQHEFTPQELLQLSFEMKPDHQFEPGTSSDYSNANTVLLGLVIERVTGKKFGQVLKEKILFPYGLTGTEWPTGTGFSKPHVHGYTEKPDQPNTDSTNFSPSIAYSAGQMISTLDDLTKWTKLLGTGAIVGPELQAERMKWKQMGQNTPEWHYTFGIEAGTWIGHNGQIPGYQAYAVYNPKLNATFVLTVNSDKLVEGEPGMNLLVIDVSKTLFPNDSIFVPKVGG